MSSEDDVTAAIAALQKFRSDCEEALRTLEALPPKARGLDLEDLRKSFRESERALERLTLDLSQRKAVQS